MGLFDKVTSFVKREAKDVGDAATQAKDKLDDELTKREAELAMTPSEKISAIQADAEATDSRFDEIAAKAAGQDAHADAVAELAGDDQPTVTQIVLPDGSVHSGDDVQPDDQDADDDAGDATLGQEQPAVTAAPTDTHADVDAPALADALPPPPAPAAVQADDDVAEGAIDEIAIAEPAADASPLAEQDLADDAVEIVIPDLDEPAEAAVVDSTETTETDAGDASEHEAPPVDLSVLPPPPSSIVDSGGRVVAELDAEAEPMPQADTKEPDVETEPEAAASVTTERDYGKTPAQIKYEEAREAANQLLAELRGELEADGKI